MAYSVFRIPNSLTVTPASSGNIVAIVQGASGQAVDLTQWQTYTGSVLARVDNAGNISGVTGYYSGDITIGGGDLISSTASFNLINTTATSLNIGQASTTTNLGAGNGTVTIGGTTAVNTLTATGTINANGGTIATNQTTANLLNTTATTINFGGASTSTIIGATNGTVTVNGNLQFLNATGNTITATGTINANGGTIATNQTTANLYNVTATTVNMAGSATTLNIATGVMTSGVVNIGTNNTSGIITLGSSTSTTTIAGNLIVNGTTTTVNSTTINIDDLNLNIASDVATAAAADGGGITVGSGLGITMNYDNTNTAWTSSQNFNIVTGKSYKIAGSDVLNATGIGAGVVVSNLQRVGTIATGVWNGTVIGTGYTQAQVVAVSGTAARTTIGGTASWPVIDLATVSQGATGTSFVKVGIDAFGRVINNTAVASGDIPNHSAAQITAGTLAVAQGGTNISSYTTGDILYASASNVISRLAATTSGLFLRTNGAGTAPSFYTLSSGDITTALGYTPANSTSGISGSGSANTLAVWNGVGSMTYDNDLLYNPTTNVMTLSYTSVTSSGDVTVGASITTIDQFPTGTYRSAKYLVQTKNAATLTPTIAQISEVLVIHDGVANAYITEYGQIYTSGTQSLLNLSATVTGGNVLVQGTSNTGGNVFTRFTRTSMSV